MKITRISALSGKTRTREMDVTQAQLNAYEDGAYLQDAFPHLSADDREFIKTGITTEEWDAAFGGGDDE